MVVLGGGGDRGAPVARFELCWDHREIHSNADGRFICTRDTFIKVVRMSPYLAGKNQTLLKSYKVIFVQDLSIIWTANPPLFETELRY